MQEKTLRGEAGAFGPELMQVLQSPLTMQLVVVVGVVVAADEQQQAVGDVAVVVVVAADGVLALPEPGVAVGAEVLALEP